MIMRGWRSEQDERSIAVENRAGNVAYQVTGYMLILDMVLHTWRPGLTEWNFGLLDRAMPVDILVILLAGGIAQWAVILQGRVVGRRRAVMIAAALTASVLAAAAIAVVLARM